MISSIHLIEIGNPYENYHPIGEDPLNECIGLPEMLSYFSRIFKSKASINKGNR